MVPSPRQLLGAKTARQTGTSALIHNELATQARRPGSAVFHLIVLGVNVYRLGSPLRLPRRPTDGPARVAAVPPMAATGSRPRP